jgi:hypothetical protein
MSMRWYQHALRKFEARLQARNQLCYLALIQSLGEFLVAIAASVVAAEAFHGGAAREE